MNQIIPFRAYVKTAESTYLEHFGLDFEQFVVGQKFQHRPGITVSQQDNANEALDTINNAQLHYDEHYASKTEWTNCLGVSTMTLQKIIGMAKTFARKKRIIEFEDIAMTHPVFGGDTLYSETEIISLENYDDNNGLITAVTTGVNQHDDIVAKIQYKILVYKSGMHPVEIKDKLIISKIENAKFSSHRLIEDNIYREQVGIYFEDLIPGEVYDHRPGKTFSIEENRLHALRSIELSPQYSNEHFASQYQKGKISIAEPFIVGVLTALTTRTFDRVVANLGWHNIKLHENVFAGDTIYARSTIIDKRESKSRPSQGIMHVKSEAFNQNNKLVCSYERHFLVYKKGLGPYAKAGY